jgi:hypothetical protein
MIYDNGIEMARPEIIIKNTGLKIDFTPPIREAKKTQMGA